MFWTPEIFVCGNCPGTTGDISCWISYFCQFSTSCWFFCWFSCWFFSDKLSSEGGAELAFWWMGYRTYSWFLILEFLTALFSVNVLNVSSDSSCACCISVGGFSVKLSVDWVRVLCCCCLSDIIAAWLSSCSSCCPIFFDIRSFEME